MAQLNNKICLIGGSGDLVLESAIFLKNNHNLTNIILIDKNNKIEKKFSKIVFKFQIKNFVGIIDKLKKLQINNILIIGYVKFPKINQIKFDLQSKVFLTKQFFLNNESEQTKIFKKLLITKDIKLLSPKKYLRELLIKKTDEIQSKNFDKYKNYLLKNANNINKLKSVNIGQSIILNGNRILSLENFKGTDEMINLFKKSSNYEDLIFIKFKKSNQINEIDFPIFGVNTIKNLIKIKIKAIILYKNQTLIENKPKCVELIKNNKINLIVI